MTVSLPTSPSFRLDGRSALVTGASRGIGLAAAVALAEAGAEVTLAARSVDDLTAAASAINERCKKLSAVDPGHKGSASALALDTADPASIESVVEALPALDILVNNAGIGRHGPMMDTTLEDFDAVMNVNLRGAYRMAQLVVRKMIASGKRGSIITTSSQMGHIGGVDRSVYCASKFAVEGWTRALAIEIGKNGIRVNTICPTFIRTPLTESTLADPERVEWIMSKIKLDRLGELEDIMGPVVFLASDASALITGSSLMIDGGWTAG